MKCTLVSTSAFITTSQEIKAKLNCDALGCTMTHFFRIPHKYLGRWAGTPEHRLRQLHEAFTADDHIVWNTLGESGIVQLIENINYNKLKPKTIIGSSDFTLLVNAVAQKRGCPALFGPNASTKIDETSMQFLKDRIDKKPASLQCRVIQKAGKKKVRGKLAGGDLLSVTWGLGSTSEIDFKGKIAFFNKLGKSNYSTYNNLMQLKNTKEFAPKAIIFLKLPRKDLDVFKKMVKELFPDIPLIYKLNGQERIKKMTIPIHWDCTINVEDKTVSMKPSE